MNLVSAPLPSSATSAGRRWRAMISSLQIVATTCQVVSGRFGCSRSPCCDSLAMFCSDVFEGRGSDEEWVCGRGNLRPRLGIARKKGRARRSVRKPIAVCEVDCEIFGVMIIEINPAHTVSNSTYERPRFAFPFELAAAAAELSPPTLRSTDRSDGI